LFKNLKQKVMKNSKKLYRCADGLVGGVAGGLADYFGIDRSWIRIIWLLLILGYGFGALPYIIMWMIVPEE
jgi:phage shock protein PspC (stress-responsive transcriptional regulator)